MKNKWIAALLVSMSMISVVGMSTFVSAEESQTEEILITLSDEEIQVNGEAIQNEGGVYAAADIIYYEDKDTYESGNPYGAGDAKDKHSEEEAQGHTVIHIAQPGTYRITGTLSQGQIAVDLGDDAKKDPEAKVTLILDNADITCSVAPAVIFYKVYECDTAYLEAGDDYQAPSEVDTTAAGANVVIADGSVNHVTGAYVAKVYKDEEGESKKYKYDGAFYSRMSMNIDGEEAGDGVLNITGSNEGLDSELHLTVNGGIININSQDDAINTNEDGVSVTTINGGRVHICGGLGAEGDGIDSNGYLVINGGVVIASANPASDSGLDSDMGSYVNGGIVIATGSTMDWAESDSTQVTMNLQFSEMQGSDEAIVITDTDGNPIFAYEPQKDESSGNNARGYQGAVISTPKLEVGQDVNVYIGGVLTGTETNGIYDIDSEFSFEQSVQMQYSGNQLGFGFGSFGPGGLGKGGERPDGNNFQGGDMPQMPDGGNFQGGDMPQMPDGGNFQNGEVPQMPDGSDFQGGEKPQMPEGSNFQGGEKPQMPDGSDFQGGEKPQMPDGSNFQGGEMPQMPDGSNFQGGAFPGNQNSNQEESEPSTVFTMTDKVNAFANVTEVTQ